jgi:hypothetical protein
MSRVNYRILSTNWHGKAETLTTCSHAVPICLRGYGRRLDTISWLSYPIMYHVRTWQPYWTLTSRESRLKGKDGGDPRFICDY